MEEEVDEVVEGDEEVVVEVEDDDGVPDVVVVGVVAGLV